MRIEDLRRERGGGGREMRKRDMSLFRFLEIGNLILCEPDITALTRMSTGKKGRTHPPRKIGVLISQCLNVSMSQW